jgi:hypothetical protein
MMNSAADIRARYAVCALAGGDTILDAADCLHIVGLCDELARMTAIAGEVETQYFAGVDVGMSVATPNAADYEQARARIAYLEREAAALYQLIAAYVNAVEDVANGQIIETVNTHDAYAALREVAHGVEPVASDTSSYVGGLISECNGYLDTITAAYERLEVVLCASIDGTPAERLAWCVEQVEMWAKEDER